MEELFSVVIVLVFVGSGVTGLYSRYPGNRWIALVFSGISCIILLCMIPGVDTVEYPVSIWMNPLTLHIFIDGFSLFFGAILSFLFVMTIVYSSYIKKKRYYPLLLLNLGVLLLAIFSKQVLAFYVFLELSTITTYFLIIHKETKESLQAGFKYVVMNVGGAVLILLAVLDYTSQTAPVFFVTGCLVKAGSFPVHVWLADAHPAAPSPVSALLSGIMVKTGVYGLFRFAPYFNIDLSLVVPFALVSMIFGVLLALIQSDVKRILAYHTVSQVGFILLGIGLQSELGISGGLLHLINHAVFKALLFLCMGCVIHATGKRDIHHLGGLQSKMPLTATACLVGCLSISGIPPFNGFVSKTLLFHALDSEIFKVIFVITCAGTVASFIKLFRHTFLGELKIPAKNVSVSMKIPLLVLSGLCIFLGIFPQTVLSLTGYTSFVWSISALSECFLPVGLGIAIYVVGLKTRIILEPIHTRITIDTFFHKSGRAVEYSSKMLSKMLIQDTNYYVMYMILLFVLFFFLLNT